MHVVSYVIGAMFFVVAVALCVAGTIASVYAKPVTEEPDLSVEEWPPSLFCSEIGCFEMLPCCKHGECDICAEFGSHAPPEVYVGKHRQTESRRERYYRTGE